jgi:hypothetical protein
MEVCHHVYHLDICIILLEEGSHHLLPNTIVFTMVDLAHIVSNESILEKISVHLIL